MCHHGPCIANVIRDVIPVQVPEQMCEPCTGQVVGVAALFGSKCPKPSDVVAEVAPELNISLRTTRDNVLKELYHLKIMYEIPENLTTLVHIDGLSDIEKSVFVKDLPKDRPKNKPIRLLYIIYIRTLLLSAYTDALAKIYERDHRHLSENLNAATRLLRTISCTTKGLVGQLGVTFKDKITKALCEFTSNIDHDRSSDYETAILLHGNKLLEQSETDLSELIKISPNYDFKCKDNSRAKLRYKKKSNRRKQARLLKKNRRKNRNKIDQSKDKNRRKNRNEENKPNKKRHKICELNKKGKMRCRRKGKKSGRSKDRKKGRKINKTTHNNINNTIA